MSGLVSSTQNWAAKTVLIKWKAMAGVTYTAKYSTSKSFTSATYRNTTGAAANLTGIQPGHTYYAVVRAVKGKSVGAYSTTMSFSLTPGYTGLFSSVAAKPASNGVTVTWGAAPYATDYRVVSSAGPNPNRRPDYWAPSTSAWFSAFDPVTKSRTITGSDANLTKTAYGNPIYAHVEARSTIKPSTHTRDSKQVVAWPTPVAPDKSALPVKFGSYNVECGGCEKSGTPKWPTRGPLVAQNVTAQKIDVLTALEASGDADNNSKTGWNEIYLDLDKRLANLTLTDTGTAPSKPNQGNRIYYNPAKYTLVGKGWLRGIHDYSQPAGSPDLNTPWAELQSKDATKTTFIVVAAHYGIPTTTNKNTRKNQLGQDSAELLKALAAVNTSKLPVILGGDFNDNRYPEGRTDGAQPTLIRGGFYDSSAALARHGTTRSTYNDSLPPVKQPGDPNGDGQRIDYILTQGFQGSDQFTNNYIPVGTNGKQMTTVPSDHNLIDASLHVPAKRVS
ncbi:hypothetical protein GCM10025867_37900 [Frondihabitans sucicola]|uniref:Fibronectin type-III domain-containing protein n=1 Tax=Frondihabitans sucicola TaxID=1268041 RepID=A0ABM8GT86_9MICO|nr:hypothetical protein GCM10025867_37900 [Frondihabitans sucicola]